MPGGASDRVPPANHRLHGIYLTDENGVALLIDTIDLSEKTRMQCTRCCKARAIVMLGNARGYKSFCQLCCEVILG